MTFLTNGDFSDGLNGWTVQGGGTSAPSVDPATGGVIFGNLDDITGGDILEQEFAPIPGDTEVTLSFDLSLEFDTFGGGGIQVQVSGPDGNTFNETIQLFSPGSTTQTFTFTTQFEVDTIEIFGVFSFGDPNGFILLDNIVLEGDSVPCFTSGTMISTPAGQVAIETLKVGDLVSTADHGAQSIRWVGSRKIKFSCRPPDCKLRPITIRAGALGLGVPNVDIQVSRQHRMLVSSKIAERMFGVGEVLVPATHLLPLPNVEIDTVIEEVEYFHIMFDQHQIIWADGAPTESFFFGPEAIKSLGPAARAEMEALFPELFSGKQAYEPARAIPARKRQKKLIERHANNAKPILSAAPQAPRFQRHS